MCPRWQNTHRAPGCGTATHAVRSGSIPAPPRPLWSLSGESRELVSQRAGPCSAQPLNHTFIVIHTKSVATVCKWWHVPDRRTQMFQDQGLLQSISRLRQLIAAPTRSPPSNDHVENRHTIAFDSRRTLPRSYEIISSVYRMRFPDYHDTSAS